MHALADLPLAWMLWFLHSPVEGHGGTRVALWNALLLVVFAVVHSALARETPKRYLARALGTPWVRPAYVAVSGATLSAVLGLWQPVAGEVWRATGPAYLGLTAIHLAAVAGLVYAASRVDYAEFLGIRGLLASRRGRPPRPPIFTAEGPYAYCRHPMYLFLLAALWITPVKTWGGLEFAALTSLYLFVGTALEERNLRQELGEVYELYRENVPMWVPRRTAWRRPPGGTAAEAAGEYPAAEQES